MLGEDHDYAILMAFAENRGGQTIDRDRLRVLTALCTARQAELRAAAAPRGARLFAETAGHWAGCVERYWNSAVRLAALQPAPEAGAVGRSQRGARRQGAARSRRRQRAATEPVAP